jgi:hypothetical protein
MREVLRTNNMQEALTKSAAVVLSTLALAGCAGGRWFETGGHPGQSTPPSSDTGASDQKSTSAAYIRSLCSLPREQRQTQVRELNEALLPDNIVISCGRSGVDSP